MNIEEIYSHHLKDLVFQAINDKGDYLNFIKKFRLEKLRQLSSYLLPQMQVLDHEIDTFVEKFQPFKDSKLIPGDFQTIRQKETPLLHEPSVYKISLSNTATEEILSLISNSHLHQLIEKIFSESNFKLGDRRYRSTSSKNGTFIEGENTSIFRSFVGICHELGHCLSERNYYPEYIFQNDTEKSETIAHLFEEHFSYLWFQSANLSNVEWSTFQRKVDQVNFKFFKIELEILESVMSKGSVNLLDNQFDVLRESMFSTPGYQYIFAKASLERLKINQNMHNDRHFFKKNYLGGN